MKKAERIMQRVDFDEPCSEGYIQEEKLYLYIKNYAKEHGLVQTQKVLPYAKEKHAGQTRKGEKIIPYIYHPLMVAYHAISLGLDEDNLVSAAILHDVCEDCGVAPEDLPTNEETRTAVALLTKSKDVSSQQYFTAISKNKIALMVKILDRCNNVSDMVKGFSKEKIKSYIEGTRNYVYPLLQIAKENYPEYTDALFLLEYHMISVVTSVNALL